MQNMRIGSFKIRNAVVPIVIVNIVMFVLQLVLGPWFTENLLLVASDVFARPWTLLTSMFLHSPGSFIHIFFNMYVLFIFGPLVERRVGTKRFLLVYFVSGLLGGLIWALFNPGRSALGASGAVMGIIGMAVMLFPNLPVLLFFFIPMTLRTAGILIALVDIIGLFPGVARTAHLVGLGTGALFGYYLTKRKGGTRKRRVHRVHPQGTIELSEEDVQEYLRTGRL